MMNNCVGQEWYPMLVRQFPNWSQISKALLVEDVAALQVAEAVAAVAAVVAAAVAAAMAAVVAAVAAAGAVGAAGAAGAVDPAVAAMAAAVVVPSMVQVKEGCLAASTGWWNHGVRVFPQASGSRSARVNLIEMIEMVSLAQFCSSVLEAGFYSLAPGQKSRQHNGACLDFSKTQTLHLRKDTVVSIIMFTCLSWNILAGCELEQAVGWILNPATYVGVKER